LACQPGGRPKVHKQLTPPGIMRFQKIERISMVAERIVWSECRHGLLCGPLRVPNASVPVAAAHEMISQLG